MKTLKNKWAVRITIAYLAITMISCNSDSGEEGIKLPPTKEAFSNLKKEALEKLVQEFQIDASDGMVTLTSEKGVEIGINTACLTELNGSSITGNIDIKFVELFNKGNMALTNKPTMGMLPDGNKAMLLTGGEFLIKASNNGNELKTNCGISLKIPTALTNGDDPSMILWNGTIDEDDNLTWEEDKRGPQGAGGEIFVSDGKYNAIVSGFGWSNVDRFYSDPRPKTTLKVKPPTGYDFTNSAVYLSYDGESTGLANLDTYDEDGDYFSEHYGQIPIGLECHVIFMTEDSGNWSYAIKSVTIAANDVITFTLGELTTGTATQLETAIDNLP